MGFMGTWRLQQPYLSRSTTSWAVSGAASWAVSWRSVRRLVLVSLLTSACATQPRTAPVASLASDGANPSYRVWNEGALWRVRVVGRGPKSHRFQGSVTGLSGGIVEVTPDTEALREHVAQVGNSVQFDFEAAGESPPGGAGFDVRVTGGCLRFDLLVDGNRHPEWVRLGPGDEAPSKLPAQRCP